MRDLFKDQKRRNLILFIILATLASVTLIIGVVFIGISASDYVAQVKLIKENFETNPTATNIMDVPLFSYGIFLLVMSIICWVGTGLFGNSTFNKKYQNQQN